MCLHFNSTWCGHVQAYTFLEGALAKESAFLRKAVQSHLKRRSPKCVQLKELAKRLDFAGNEHENITERHLIHAHDLGMEYADLQQGSSYVLGSLKGRFPIFKLRAS